MTPDLPLVVIVPTRSRPQNLAPVVTAWHDTGAFADGAALLFVVDGDDPDLERYHREFADSYVPGANMGMNVAARWEPLVPKLNRAARQHATGAFALGFAGDDHLPRSAGWAHRYWQELMALGTGIVHGDDGTRGELLPTEWAMTADIVRALDRMVPADVEHLFCDDAIKRLGLEADCLRYLPDVLIEHMHPLFGKALADAQYERVNRPSQYNRDGAAFGAWMARELAGQAQIIRGMKIKNDR